MVTRQLGVLWSDDTEAPLERLDAFSTVVVVDDDDDDDEADFCHLGSVDDMNGS